MTEAARLEAVFAALRAAYPAVAPGLCYRTPWELLVATVLSAQATDRGVNRVTPALFARYPGPAALGVAEPGEVEDSIRTLGLFRTKARSLVGLARRIAADHGGRVPPDREALEALPGVGRKTASVVLAQAFGLPAFAVDTHVARVCHRLGFAPDPSPRAVEERVTALLPPDQWGEGHLLLIHHGRATCSARSPRCPACPARPWCPWPP